MQHALATCLTPTLLYSTAAPQSHTTSNPPHIYQEIQQIVSNENYEQMKNTDEIQLQITQN